MDDPVYRAVRVTQHDLQVGSYGWAKQRSHAFAECLDRESAAAFVDRELHRPTSSTHHKTVYVLGKPYHWRQDYTGQLKLAAGESPWGTNVH